MLQRHPYPCDPPTRTRKNVRALQGGPTTAPSHNSPTIMSKRSIGFGHSMRFVTLLDCSASTIRSIHQLSSKLFLHAATRPRRSAICQPATHGRVRGPSPEVVQTDARAAGKMRPSTRPQGTDRLDHASSRVFRSIAGFNFYIEGGTLRGSHRERSLPNQESTGRPSRKATPEPGGG